MPVQAWVSENTYLAAGGLKLNSIIAAPADPAKISRKLPVVIFEEGDGTTGNVLNDHFMPAQMAPMMETVSRKSGLVWVAPELRRQHFSGQGRKICDLDFNHRAQDLNDFVDFVKQFPFVDQGKVFLVGHSAGADKLTQVAIQNSNIKAVINVAGGVSSCYESGVDCPVQLAQLISHKCSGDNDLGRTGIWWVQLFLSSHMYKSVSETNVPYLALAAANDQVLSLNEFKRASAQLLVARRGFEAKVIQNVDHGTIMTSPDTMAVMLDFIARHSK